ncbi:hypothetical protein TNCV_1279231 [Trichonephila clavipes]|nr:hypothetical protein TNCV_1279231 [Trichonephila clavipes]
MYCTENYGEALVRVDLIPSQSNSLAPRWLLETDGERQVSSKSVQDILYSSVRNLFVAMDRLTFDILPRPTEVKTAFQEFLLDTTVISPSWGSPTRKMTMGNK